MKQRAWLIFGAGAIVGAVVFASGARWASAPSSLSAEQEKQVESIIQNRLIGDPDLLIAALTRAKERAEAKRADTVRSAIVADQGELLQDPNSPTAGDAAGKVSVVEFFDYRCPHCKAMEPTMSALLAADPTIRVVYKEFPILGGSSVIASRVALAAMKQGKYADLRRALIASKGELTEDEALKIAASVGLDTTKLKAAMSTGEGDATINRNKQLGAALGITVTPTFVIGDEVLTGETHLSDFRHAIADAKKSLQLQQ